MVPTSLVLHPILDRVRNKHMKYTGTRGSGNVYNTFFNFDLPLYYNYQDCQKCKAGKNIVHRVNNGLMTRINVL